MKQFDGYIMFHGTMRITPMCNVEPFEITCDWLFKPEFGNWYGAGSSFPEEICTIVRDDDR